MLCHFNMVGGHFPTSSCVNTIALALVVNSALPVLIFNRFSILEIVRRDVEELEIRQRP